MLLLLPTGRLATKSSKLLTRSCQPITQAALLQAPMHHHFMWLDAVSQQHKPHYYKHRCIILMWLLMLSPGKATFRIFGNFAFNLI